MMFSHDEVEEMLIAAYKRGFEWHVENGCDREYLPKAARDYADKTMHEKSLRIVEVTPSARSAAEKP